MAIDPDNTAGLSSATLEEIDRCCFEFEQQWQSGSAPSIHGFLNLESSSSHRQILLAELLVLDMDYRRRQGQRVAVHEYLSRFPDYSDTIQQVFGGNDCFPSNGETRGPEETKLEWHSVQSAAKFPEQIGRYKICESLGAGGFASVYRARDQELQRDVAIKFAHPGFPGLDGHTDLFLKEARTLATLSHPAIAAVYDVGRLDDGQNCFVVSQYIDNGDLAERIASERPSLQESVSIVTRMAEALHYAHSRGFVHRDVKPSNILLDSQGKPWLADFGLALGEPDVGRKYMEFAGSRDYMSPEQVRGQGHLVDGRADIYSLGVVLYELLTGKKPFASPDLIDLAEQIQFQPPRPLRQIDDNIPVELERICLQAMAKSPSERYPTALDMARDLQAVIAPPDHRPAHRIARQKIIFGTVVLCLAMIAGVFASRFIGSGDHNATTLSNPDLKIESLAVLPFRPLQLEAQDEYLGLSLADAVIMRLSNLRQLQVRPTGSVRIFVDQQVDPIQAGQLMQVDAVVDASIQKIGDTTRISARLVRTVDGKTLWAETFEGGNLDAFSLQDSIVEKIAGAISLKLEPNEQTTGGQRHVPDPESYNAYLKGRYYWHQRSSGYGIQKTINFFKESIDRDPLFPLAHLGLAECYALMDYYSYYQIEDVMPLARASALEALRLDNELIEAHRVLAFISFTYDWQWKRAEELYLRAIELNPNDATARQWYGELLMYLSRFDESKIQFAEAARLNPLSEIIYSMQGSPSLLDRDFVQARIQFNQALQIYPDSIIALFGLAYCDQLEGNYQHALEIFQRYTSPGGQSTAASIGEAFCMAKLGRNAEARVILDELTNAPNGQQFTPYGLATICAAIGDDDQAFQWLDKAFDQRDDLMVMLRVDSQLDSLRSDSRFDALVDRMKFPD